ncbi:MucBP domain-containing protein [uncultured Vagococcus sp.]|uniref:MucBP domain-containing protein n=1 Tax=uncultured Vagococcus sp. TaxID=189676 RepID=UPI0028D7E49E|nr:MucBP domain-containing protein [uncultured Vagococcus sp.]
MTKIKKFLTLLMMLVVGFTIVSSQTIKLKAETPKATPRILSPTPWILDNGIPGTGEKYVQVGKLRYGLSDGTEVARNTFTAVPNVEYMEDETTNIKHLFDYKIVENQTPTPRYNLSSTPAFNIVETNTEYIGVTTNRNGGMADFDDVSRVGNKILATGKKLSNDDFLLSVSMEANENQTAVRHEYKIKNTSLTEKTIYPLKKVDTQLNMNDEVPIYSRGKNKGVYIESPEDEKKPEAVRYRLDYIMNNDENSEDYDPTSPEFYAGKLHSSRFNVVFGNDMDNQSSSQMAEEAGKVILENQDTGIFMSWGKKTLIPGQEITLSYEVGIKPMESLEKTKTAKNLTRPESGAKNQVGDEIEYTISIASPNYASKDLRITDDLSWAFEDPTGTVEVTDGLGTVTQLPMSQVYKKNSSPSETSPYVGAFNIPGDGHTPYALAKGEKMTIKFKAKLAERAAGMSVVNKAGVTGTTDQETKIKEEVETENPLPVENVRPVIVKHVDMAGNPLVPAVADLPITGSLGEVKPITPQPVNGYTYNHASISDPLQVTITTSDQEVLLYYKENRFTIKQEVVKADNSSATSVKVEDALSYKITVESKLDASATYKDFVINAKITGEIGNLGEWKLVSSLNPTVPLDTPDYDPITGTITATVKPSDNVPSNANLILTYTGKVKADAEPGDKITAEARANGDYSNGMMAAEIKAPNFVSNVDAGQLIFESAPATMNFGENHGIKLTDQIYPLVTKDTPLAVKDLRGSSSQWTMMATVTKVLTNASKGNHTLPNALNYQSNGVPTVLTKDDSFPIASHTTTSTAIVDISQSWETANNRPFVKVKGGEAKNGAYDGEITWTLRDGL